MPVKIFCCYAHEDEAYLNKLKTQLSPLRRQGLIDVWHDRNITAGADWESDIDQHLNAAQIVLLLVSPDFINSDYCYGIEMKRALERNKRGEAIVIPVILRPVLWENLLGKLQAVPRDNKPVKRWSDEDEALYEIVKEIHTVIQKYNDDIQIAAKTKKFHLRVEYEIVQLSEQLMGEISINPEAMAHGERLRLRYYIHSEFSMQVPIWLGANIKAGDQYYYHTAEDSEEILEPGQHTYQRFFTIGDDWPSGRALLAAEVWYGKLSDPSQSFQLTNPWTHTISIVL
jgi:hypothetical protein